MEDSIPPPAYDTVVKTETGSVVVTKKDIPEFKKILWMCNTVEIGVVAFHAIFIVSVPEHYMFYMRKCYFAIAAAILQMLITTKMTKNLQCIQMTFSFLHFLWLFYCFATVPVFLTAITSPLEECDPLIQSCASGIYTDTFHTKMTMGIMSQLIFGLCCYGEIKRLCVIYNFPYMESEVSPQRISSEVSVSEEIAEKDPKEVVVVA